VYPQRGGELPVVHAFEDVGPELRWECGEVVVGAVGEGGFGEDVGVVVEGVEGVDGG